MVKSRDDKFTIVTDGMRLSRVYCPVPGIATPHKVAILVTCTTTAVAAPSRFASSICIREGVVARACEPVWPCKSRKPRRIRECQRIIVDVAVPIVALRIVG
jgi:hypothetical protein